MQWAILRAMTINEVTTSLLVISLLGLVGCHRGQSTDELVDDLRLQSSRHRIKAARLLESHHGDGSQVIPALIQCLDDSDKKVRRSAAIGLGNYGSQAASAIPALEARQRDPDVRVREAATVALSRIRH